MRLSQVLYKYNVARMANDNWKVSRKRPVFVSKVQKQLEELGIPIIDANEYINEKVHRKNIRVEIVQTRDQIIPRDEQHPDYKKIICHVLNEHGVLLEGLMQALILTKTIHVANTLPEHIEQAAKDNTPDHIHNEVEKAIMYSNMFDCEQRKLSRKTDSVRPAHVYALNYGITDVRKNFTITNRLHDIVERISQCSKERLAIRNAEIVTSFEKDADLIQLQSPSSILVSAPSPLKPIVNDFDFTVGVELPNIYPIKHTITLKKEHFYDFDNVYPLSSKVHAQHPHTSFLSFNKTQVKNLYESEVTENQIKGRTLTHAFSVAAAYAKSTYGHDATDLPQPVTVQCIHSDGCNFRFGIFQLNTLNLEGKEGLKNLWYSSPKMQLFESCKYLKGRPTFSGYNPQVFNYINALYNSS